MKNGLLKAFSFILALSIVLSSMSIVVFASDDSQLGIVGGNVELDLTNGSTVTVSVVAKEDLTFYGIEGIWDINEQGENKYFTLTGISSEVLDFSGRNYADEKTGELLWVDDLFTSSATAADTKIFSATYKVAHNTPDGEYIVRFTSTVFTGADAIPDETETVYEAVITVTHKCSVAVQSGKPAACSVAGWNDYYKCTHCGKCYVDAAVTQKITDLEAWKLADGKLPALVHKDDDKNHVCDSGCDKAFGECVDDNKDHKCDYGCSKFFGAHEDVEPKDHICDYGCSEKIGEHVDADNDHKCDYGCIYSDGGCVDTDKDHKCDYSGCGKEVGVHEDTNKDHKCDYGCNVQIGDHVDTKNNHTCVYGCGISIGEHVDNNKDHICDHGCSKQIGECEDNDLDHWCDYGCGYYHNSFRHRDQDGDHKCDYGCKEPIEDHADGDDEDHLCDYCFKDVGETCYDENKDHKCDECTKAVSVCADNDKNHACDYEGCKAPMGGDHAAAEGKHTCDYCGKPATFCKDCLKNTDATDSTCKVMGNSEYYTCTVCGKYYSDAEAAVEIEKDSWLLPLAEHKYESKVTAPTCEDKGYTTYTCSVCGNTYVDAETKPDGHKYESKVTASTCLNGGYTTHTCTVCGHSYTDALTDPTGHVTYGDITYTWNADNSECTASHTCSCGYTETQKVTSTSAITTTATCTANQVTTYTAVFEADWIPEADRTQTKAVEGDTAPDNHTKTCEYTINENGTHTKTYPCCGATLTEAHTYVNGKCVCNNVQTFTITWVNGDVTKTTTVAYGEVPVVPEDIGELAKAPDIDNHYTFTGWGEVVEAVENATYFAIYSGAEHDYTKNCKVCSVCNYSSDGTRAHKVGNPTCVDDAVCETCGTVVLKALGHLFTYNVTKCYWSIDDNGNRVYHFVATCSREDNCHETDEVAVIAIQQEEGYKAPTCIADGSATYVAAIPADVEQSWAKALLNSESGVVSKLFPIDALGHELTETAAKAATCTEAGTEGYWTCGRCFDVFADAEATVHTTVEAREIDALGHDWKCKAGVDYLICNREGCDATTTEDVDTAHSWVSENETPATCTKPGEHAGRDCSVCGKVVGGGVIQPLGHKYGETSYVWTQDVELGKWVCTATHTCTREGCAAEEGNTETATATVAATVVIPSTCKVMGSTRYTATFEESWAKGDVMTKQDVALADHTPDNGIITKSPFYNKEGEKTYYCTECEAIVKTEVVPATGVINISVLGDSITAFENYSNGTAANTTNSTLSGGRVWFPMTEREFDSEGNPIDKGTGEITEAAHIWIYRAAEQLGANILVNNSWSGSAVHFWQYGVAGMWQDRVVQLHDNTGANSGQEPDIIVVYMGTNDFKYTELVNGSYAQLQDGSYYQSVLGTYADVNFDALIIDNGDGTFTYAEPQNTMEAYAISFHKMQQRYPNSELYVMTILPFRAGIHQPTDFNDDLRQMAAHFGVTVVEIEDTGIESNEKNFEYLMEDWLHPNLKGMEVLANAFESTVRNTSDLFSDEYVNVSYDMSGVAAMEGTTRTALVGKDFFASFKLYDQSLAMQITVLYGGVDITDSCVTVVDDAKLGGKIVYVNIANVTDDIEITATAHKHEYNSVVTDPTCTEGGYTTYTCACGDSYKANEVAAKGHSYTLISDKVAEEATCTTDAVYYAKCANCGDVHTTEKFAKENTKLGHSYNAKDSKKEASKATCTEPARNYVQCDRCDAVSTDKTVAVGKELGHSFASAEYTWQYDATNKVWICTAKRVCSNDATHIETAAAAVTSKVKQAATCTAKGTTTYTATFAIDWATQQTKDVEDIAVLGHAYGETTYEWSNGNMNCTAKRVCKNDESHVDTIEATVESVVTTEVTCTKDGLKKLTATFVVDWAETQTTTEVIPAKGHTETIIPEIPATCVEPGLTEGKRCNVCNTITVSQKWIPMIDHTWSDTAVYTDNGDGTHTATYTCVNGCNKTKKDAPEAHKYEDGTCVACGSDAALAGYMKGDVNLDGSIDAKDLTTLARHVAKIEYLTDPVALDNADINGDGQVTAEDLTKLARHVAKIEYIS